MQLKELPYLNLSPTMSMEDVFFVLLQRGLVSYPKLTIKYVDFIERQKDDTQCKFNEATTCLVGHLSGNFRGKDKEKLYKRSIHIVNKNGTFPVGVYDEKYGYTEEDEQSFEKDYELHYKKRL